jgi:cation transport ATPase
MNFPETGRKETEMKKTYKIEVDCAACAALMEDAAKKTGGVADCVVNFMTQKMNVEFEDGADEGKVMKDVLKACRKVESDCEIEL